MFSTSSAKSASNSGGGAASVKNDPFHPHISSSSRYNDQSARNFTPVLYNGAASAVNLEFVSSDSFHGYDLHSEELNHRLNSVKKEFGLRRAVSRSSLSGETRTFAEILDQEVETIVFYYLEVQGILAKHVRHLRGKQIAALQDFTITLDKIDALCTQYREIGQEVLSLLTYLERNSLALKRILHRHDQLFDQKMGSMYFDTRLVAASSSRSSQLKQLYHQEGIKAIVDAIRRGFEELYDARRVLIEANNERAMPLRSQQFDGSDDEEGTGEDHEDEDPNSFRSRFRRMRRRIVPRVPFRKRMASFSALNLLTGSVDEHAILPQRGLSDSKNLDDQSQQAHFKPGRHRSDANMLVASSTSADHSFSDSGERSLGNRARSTGSLWSFLDQHEQRESNNALLQRKRSLSELEPILRHIYDVSDRVTKSQTRTGLEFISNLDTMNLEFAMRDINRVDKQVKGEKVVLFESIITANMELYLNLLLTFLYMANQYVVAPSSAKYAAMLGMSSSMSGMIIGMAPTAALLSSLLYSMWSNDSFKLPMLTGISCAIVGNVFYGSALQCDSPMLVFAGRLLTGFGGTRVVCRRYIADHVSLGDRLWASSAFVTAGALGLAFGPLIASLVEWLNISFVWSFSHGSKQTILMVFESVTAPGWIMALLWLLSLVGVALFFNDPVIKKSGSSSSLSSDGKSPSYEPAPTQDVVSIETGNELWQDNDDDSVPHRPPLTHSSYQAGHMFPISSGVLSNSSSSRSNSSDKQPSWWNHISVEVYAMLFLTMVNKAGQEMSVACMPFVLKKLFGWESESIGYYMASIGALVLPSNLILNSLAKDTEERKLLINLSYVSLAGLLFVCQINWLGSDDEHYNVGRYLVGTALMFTTLCALEGIIMSLLSKIISPELAKGTFNSGLLATEAGTLGRVVGDMTITAFGSVATEDTLVNSLYFPLGALIVVSIYLSKHYYSKLED